MTFAVLTPFTMIYTFSAKYDLTTFYPKLLRNLGLMGGVCLLWYKVRSDQKRLHASLVDKYFSQYSD